jgi:hypothetical protein
MDWRGSQLGTFNGSLWTSLDSRYSFRGTTLVNGIDQNNAQQNFILGSEMNVIIRVVF